MSFQVFISAVTVVLALQTCYADQAAPLPSETDQKLGQLYFNFSSGVLNTLETAEADSQLPKSASSAPVAASGGADVDSVFGLGYLLAVTNEKTWPVSVPIFDKFLETAPKSLPASFEFVLNEFGKDSDIKISNTIFTPDTVNLTPGLKQLKVKVVSTDLKSKDAVSTINTNLAKQVVTALEDDYIPKDSTLSPAAKALLVNTLHFTGSWPTPAKKLPAGKFDGKDDVEMIEITGKFQVLQSKHGVEVMLPFKNDKRGLSLVLPNNIAESVKSEDLDEPKLLNVSSVRIQLPVFSVMLRVLENSGYTKCDFKKAENFLQLLDEVTYVSLNADNLEAISITGAQINNVNLFKQELTKGSGRAISQTTNNAVDPVPAPKGTDTTAPAAPSTASDSLAEKLIVFNKPFTWTVLDANLGPLFTGSVLSLDFLKKAPLATTVASTPNGNVFGMREELSYAKCL